MYMDMYAYVYVCMSKFMLVYIYIYISLRMLRLIKQLKYFKILKDEAPSFRSRFFRESKP